MKKFVIIDSNALIHRSFHAVPPTIHTPDGELVNAVFGFTGILLGILEHEKPDYFAAAFDMKGPTFRDAVYTAYKATRGPMDDLLGKQFPRVREVLGAFNIPIFEKEGLEADDYLAIVANKLREKYPDTELVIVTGDKDALQLVGEGVTVVSPISGYTKVKRYDRAAVKEKMGVWPEQVPDFKGLSGDPSDNISGVPGIGEKTACKLLEKFGSVDGIYKHIEEVEPLRIRELIRNHEETARLCTHIATLVKEDDMNLDLEKCSAHNFDAEKVRALFNSLSFRGHLLRMEKLNKDWDKLRTSEGQGTLF